MELNNYYQVIRIQKLNTVIAFCLLLFFSFSHYTLASKIEKGYKALVIFDYFQAKKYFEKSLKKDVSPASYGLALIYFRKDNPFHSLDSAYKYIKIAKSTRENVKLKMRIKLEKYNYSEESILDLEQGISKGFFSSCLSENNVLCYDQFIEKHSNSTFLNKAIFKRDSLAFELTKKETLICGLAGSLRLENIAELLPFDADYLGFRGALCNQHNRVGELDLNALEQIRTAIFHHA